MSATDFFNKYNGKPIDYDGYYGYQCMDLWHQYDKEVVGGKSFAAPYAKDVWLKNLYDTNKYTKISNTPDGVPQKGDVIIWSGAANGGFGHIAIYYDGDVFNFRSFDQNWPTGSWCHFQPHNYNYVYGWLRPKAAPVITGSIPKASIIAIRDGGGSESEKYNRIINLL